MNMSLQDDLVRLRFEDAAVPHAFVIKFTRPCTVWYIAALHFCATASQSASAYEKREGKKYD